MSTTFGLTDSGFVKKGLDDIKTSLEASLTAAFGASIRLDAASNNGQLIGVMAAPLADLWDALEAVYNSQYPDSASGSSLVNVAAITGTIALTPLRSTGAVTLTGTPSTVVPSGTLFSVTGTGVKFRTTASATIGGGGTVTDVPVESVDYGPNVAAAGTLTVIESPVSGLTGVTNPTDVTLGRLAETDPALRLRRELELRASGNASIPSLQGDILEVSGVKACTVFSNTGDVTDGNGVPPHAIECVVLQNDTVNNPADAAIRTAIFNSKAAGAATYGGVSGTVTDSQGNSYTINFSRPTTVNVYITVNVTTDPTTWPSDGATQIKNALVSWALGTLTDSAGQIMFKGYGVGDSLITSKLYTPVETIAGITDVTAIYVGTSPSPASAANIVAGSRQLMVLDTSRIVVNVT